LKRLLFCSPKGGVGKGTLCRNIAVAAVMDGLRVATADLDPQASLTIWSRRRPEHMRIPHYRVSWADAEALLEDDQVGECDALLIDTPPSIEAQPAVFGKLLSGADLIIVPCRPSFDDAESVGPFLKHMREGGMKAFAILNCVKPRVNINAVKAYLIEAGELCPVEVADRTDYARAGAKGLGLLDVPNHAGADEVQAVWQFIKGRVWGKQKEKARG
jgi:chromosome partitioning protein